MKLLSAFRLLAVPVGGAVSFGLFMPFMSGLDLAIVGMLLGFIGSMLVGIPFLLMGDRFFPGFKGRHVLSGVLQVVVTYLVYTGYSPRLLLVAALGGAVLGLLYTAFDKFLVRYAANNQVPQMSKAYVLGIPLCGGVTLAVVATLALGDGSGALASFIIFFLVGAGLGMAAGWPALWLTERFLTTRWRYVIGGVISGLLIWLLFGAPGLRPTPVAQNMNFLLYQLQFGVLLFIAMGGASGLLFSAFHGAHSWLVRRKANTPH